MRRKFVSAIADEPAAPRSNSRATGAESLYTPRLSQRNDANGMKIPKGLQPLVDDGMVDTVVRKLKSGKEASVYIVSCGGEIRCAKVYKEAEQRGFRQLARYQEGRKTRNSRDARAPRQARQPRPPGAGGRVEERGGRGPCTASRGPECGFPPPTWFMKACCSWNWCGDAAGDPALA